MITFLSKIPNHRPIVFHSDLLSLGKEILYNKKKIIKYFLCIFKKGIFVPSFNLEKKKTIRFDKFEHSMGAMTNLCIKDPTFKRIVNPIHSYIFSNINMNTLKYKNHSFGKKSIFNFFYENNCTWVNFGLNYNEGFTIFHHAEDLCNVKYRNRVLLKRKIQIKKKFFINYNYFSRKKKIIYNFNKAVKAMINKKILKLIFLKNNKKILFGNSKKIVDFLVLKINKDMNYLIKI
jgi:aminoglycoside N3'-acetyltransferase